MTSKRSEVWSIRLFAKKMNTKMNTKTNITQGGNIPGVEFATPTTGADRIKYTKYNKRKIVACGCYKKTAKTTPDRKTIWKWKPETTDK